MASRLETEVRWILERDRRMEAGERRRAAEEEDEEIAAQDRDSEEAEIGNVDADPFHTADNWSTCPTCGDVVGWNDEDLDGGVACASGHPIDAATPRADHAATAAIYGTALADALTAAGKFAKP